MERATVPRTRNSVTSRQGKPGISRAFRAQGKRDFPRGSPCFFEYSGTGKTEARHFGTRDGILPPSGLSTRSRKDLAGLELLRRQINDSDQDKGEHLDLIVKKIEEMRAGCQTN
ncbi:hypothetical protein J6590_084316 [Homalodisca vitripennis]|nr:hypothetical protein J6590_084316 [Homalodisca vitripennis]